VISVVQQEEQVEKKALEAEVLQASLTSLNAVRSCSTAAMSRLPVLAVPARMQVANWKQKQAAAALEESRQRASRQRRVARLKVQYAPALAVAELPCADACAGVCWIQFLSGLQCHAKLLAMLAFVFICRTCLQAATAGSFAVGVDTVQQLIEFLMPHRSQPQRFQPPAQPAGQQEQQAQQPLTQPQPRVPLPASASAGLLTDYEKEVFGSGGGNGSSSPSAAAHPPPRQQEQQEPLTAAATAVEAVAIAGGMAVEEGRHASSRLSSWLRNRLRCSMHSMFCCMLRPGSPPFACPPVRLPACLPAPASH
jgi:hypothetical protein